MKQILNIIVFFAVFVITVLSGFYFFLIKPNVIVKAGIFTHQECKVQYIYPDKELLNNKGIQKNILHINNSCEKSKYGDFVSNFSRESTMAYYINIPPSLSNELLKQHVFYFENKNLNEINELIKNSLINYNSELFESNYLTSFDYNLPKFIKNYVDSSKFEYYSDLDLKEIFVIVSVLKGYDIRITIFYDNSFKDKSIYNEKIQKFNLEKQVKIK